MSKGERFSRLQFSAILFSLMSLLSLTACENKETDNAVQNVTVEFDSEGRAIVDLGDIELHIPVDVRSPTTPTNESAELVQFSMCWLHSQELKKCDDDRRRIAIYLQATPVSEGFPFDDAEQAIEQRLRNYDGPTDTDADLVKQFSSSSGGEAQAFVIRSPDRSGRYPIAFCDRIACRVDFLDRPGLRVTYRFPVQLVPDWVAFDQAIRKLIDSFVLEN